MGKVSCKSGFTLIETIISLVVLLATSLVIQLVIQTGQRIKPLNLSSDANWYLFVAELESPKHSFALKDVGEQQLVLEDMNKLKFYCLSEHKTVYLRGSKGGYLPLLTDYQPRSLKIRQLDHKRVEISAETADGRQHSSRITFLSTGERNVSSNSTNGYFDQHNGD